MNRITRLLAFFTLSLLFVACQREVSFDGSGSGRSDVSVNPDPITSVLQGNVLDETGQPASGVTVQVGSQTATTDARGYFRIRNAALDKKTSFVSAAKAGYFTAFRNFAATSGTNHIEIKLTRRTLAGSVDATAGGEVGLTNGSKVALPAGGIVVASSNAAYTGSVKVYAAYIDPTSTDIGQTVPGSFAATNANNERVILTSYGMMAVELEGASGEKLQIKSGSEATLTTAIPASLQTSAPASIPLWFVDEQTGLWKEEGSATKSGNVYVGKVKHFTYWNCDIQGPTVQLNFQLKTPDGTPIVHAYVSIIRVSNNSGAAHGYTDSLGQVSGLIPANQALVLRVMDPCHNVIYSQNIGPYTQSTNLGVITVPNSTSSLVNVTGTLLNCSGQPVTNGFAMIWVGNYPRYAAVNSSGQFSISFIRCSSTTTAQVIGVDASSMQQSSTNNVTLTGASTNVGNITACGTTTQQYLTYTLDGTAFNLVAPADSLMASGGTGSTTFIAGSSLNSQSAHISFTSMATAAGTFPISNLSVNNFQQTTIIAPFNVVYTNWAAGVGQYYEGTFSGSFKDGANVTHTITNGTFRIRKMW